jgi:hypothetical protein
MTTLSFSEAAALTYIAKRMDLTQAERIKLTKGLTKRGKQVARDLHKRKSASTTSRARTSASC